MVSVTAKRWKIKAGLERKSRLRRGRASMSIFIYSEMKPSLFFCWRNLMHKNWDGNIPSEWLFSSSSVKFHTAAEHQNEFCSNMRKSKLKRFDLFWLGNTRISAIRRICRFPQHKHHFYVWQRDNLKYLHHPETKYETMKVKILLLYHN